MTTNHVETVSPAPVPATVPAQSSARAAFAAIEAALASALVGRAAEIHGLLVATLAREHVLLLGPPGTAKSLLARHFAAAISGSQYFEWLLTKFSTPEEVFGPVSFSALKADRFSRVTKGKLPEAHVAFLDEIFKANSAVLNTLLPVVNERVFHDDGGTKKVPLVTCVGASNELPESAELGAFWDRFMIRFWVGYTQTPDDFRAVLRRGLGGAPKIPTISLADLSVAQSEVDMVGFSDSTLDALFSLRKRLADEGIEVSDRRWVKAAKIVAAEAWLEGSADAEPEHFSVLASCLWNTPDQAPKVREHVQSFVSAELQNAQRVYDGIAELLARLPASDDPVFESKVLPANRELKKAVKSLDELAKAATSKGAKTKIAGLRSELASRGKDLVEAARAALIG